MKILIARLNHETNTFSPIPTPLSAFGPHGPQFGRFAYADNKGMRTAMSAFIDLAEAEGAEIFTPVSACANPSGIVGALTYSILCDSILRAAPGCDGILLDLHGAMVADGVDDGEGDLLARIRALLPAVPIGVALDLHANMTEAIVRNADVIVGFKTFPHLDMYETGAHAGRLLFAMLHGAVRPKLAWQRVPLVTHSVKSATSSGVMKTAVDQAIAAEKEGSLAVSVFAGFALADIEAPCISVVVADSESEANAQRTADLIARQIWNDREGYFYKSSPLTETVAYAKKLSENATKPVLLLDHGDNCTSGGTCDTTDVLEEAIRQGLKQIAVGPFCDPMTVAALIDAGEGARVTISLGNRVSLEMIGRKRTPIEVSGTVKNISDGEYTVTGPTYTGQRMAMGRTVLFDIGPAEIVVTERPHEPWDIGVFSCVGLKPETKRFILLKSRMYARPVFVPLSAALVECDSGGVTSSNFDVFPFIRLKRPVFPFDPAEICSLDFQTF